MKQNKMLTIISSFKIVTKINLIIKITIAIINVTSSKNISRINREYRIINNQNSSLTLATQIRTKLDAQCSQTQLTTLTGFRIKLKRATSNIMRRDLTLTKMKRTKKTLTLHRPSQQMERSKRFPHLLSSKMRMIHRNDQEEMTTKVSKIKMIKV